jgi:hypothetical protein
MKNDSPQYSMSHFPWDLEFSRCQVIAKGMQLRAKKLPCAWRRQEVAAVTAVTAAAACLPSGTGSGAAAACLSCCKLEVSSATSSAPPPRAASVLQAAVGRLTEHFASNPLSMT